MQTDVMEGEVLAPVKASWMFLVPKSLGLRVRKEDIARFCCECQAKL